MTEIVLIHGAWQGGWVWADIVPQLTAAGHNCHAVDLPGRVASVILCVRNVGGQR
jgi:pimeloyl-ACP methyl ester carboxylesterase